MDNIIKLTITWTISLNSQSHGQYHYTHNHMDNIIKLTITWTISLNSQSHGQYH